MKVLIETFSERGLSTERWLFDSEQEVRLHISKTGNIKVLKPEEFCSTCDGAGMVKYYFDQDDCKSALCPTCNNGDKKTWEKLKKLWATL